MPDFQKLDTTIPVAPLKLVVMDSARELGDSINKDLIDIRKHKHHMPKDEITFKGYLQEDYRLKFSTDRFDSGEAKATLLESARGQDIYLITDVMNHSISYQMYGFTNYKSPDDHYQDMKRVIGAIAGIAKRINIIMPFMYESRQHKRSGRESLDCAVMIRELKDMGIANFITFDAHDPRVANSAPLGGFDSFLASYQFLKALLYNIDDLIVDKEHLTVISPDEGALDRAVYFANVLGADTGMFYKRRDYSRIVGGSNPIVAHEFLGSDIAGKDVIIIDDMISSGGSMIDTARQLKHMKAKRIFICATFGLFTNGMEKFDKAYAAGDFDRIITTNLTWQPDEIKQKPYFLEADMCEFLATIIDFINHDQSIANVLLPTDKIHEFIAKYNAGASGREAIPEI